jgi:hypothetical protein
MNINELITYLLDNPSATLTEEQTTVLQQEIDANQAASALPIALMLKHSDTLDAATRQQLQSQFAIYATDREALLNMIDPTGDNWGTFYPQAPEPEAQTTGSVIDTFLQTYGRTSPEEEALIERLIFNPTPDYSQVLAAEAGEISSDSNADPDSAEARIDAFIRAHQQAEQQRQAAMAEEEESSPTPSYLHDNQTEEDNQPPTDHVNAPETVDDSLLSESLAKIFIKQHRYERAYEIITNLSLNYPKKSIYFADQLRFLQKLILIQQRSQRLNHDK